jgi:hypothetical protein
MSGPWKTLWKPRAGETVRGLCLQDVVGHLDGAEQWLVRCECGAFQVLLSSELRKLRRKRKGRSAIVCQRCWVSETQERHGLSNSPEYSAWRAAWARCHNPGHMNFADYGGRGITMDPSWHPPTSVGFVRFLAHIGKRPPGMTLERLDNNAGYWPGNVAWRSRSVQNSNQRKRKAKP